MKEVERPAIVKSADSIEMRSDLFAAKFKKAKQSLVDFLKANLDELAAIKEALPHGGWSKLCKKIKVTVAQADHWLARRKSNSPNGDFEPFDSETEPEVNTAITEKPLCTECEQNGATEGCPACWELNNQISEPESQGVVPPPPPAVTQTSFADNAPTPTLPKGWKKCSLCKAKPSRDPSKCSQCKTLNEAPAPPKDEKPPESSPDQTNYTAFWARIGNTLGKRVKQMKNALVIPRSEIDDVRKAYSTISQFIARNASADPRPQEAGKCRKCGAEVVWTTTDKHSRIPLDVKPGGGVWEVINGVASFCDWDKEAAKFRYRCHSARCVTNNRPIKDEGE